MGFEGELSGVQVENIYHQISSSPSLSVHGGMNHNRPCLKFTSLQAAGKDMNMSVRIVGQLSIA